MSEGMTTVAQLTAADIASAVHERLVREDRRVALPHTPRRIARAMLDARPRALRLELIEDLEPLFREAFADMVPLEDR